ncbi:MAG: LysR family transcriptional regulator [Desulfatiglans sp.]|jgi:DNA-binding transcriptional LysR family regulator|nr:LysR family transcriptional regulator [Desulfatiglans sp.]
MLKIDFDLRQLEIFCRVVELKSFSRAADAVFLAQASVSERIANLEKGVGTVLLDRMGRQIVPTKAGELLYKHATRMLDMKKSVKLEMEKFLGLKQGEILLGGSTIPGEYILPRMIGRFYEQYPFISVILTVAGTGEIEEMVANGDLELGIVGADDFNKDIEGQKILNDELVLVINKNHRWAAKKTITPDELSQEPFILREKGSGTLKIMEQYLKTCLHKGVDGLNVVARLGTSTAIKEVIKANFGVSILSSQAIETEVKAGILKTVKIKDMPPMTRPFYLIRDKRRVASPLCKAMIDFLVKV